MSDELPEGWAETTMGAVADVVGGGTPPAKDAANFCADGGHPWLTPADLSGYTKLVISRGARNLTAKGLRDSSARIMPKGTVLMSSRAPIGYLAIAANDISTNQGFKSFVLPPERFEPAFVLFWLRSIDSLLQELGSGSTFAEISGAKAKEIPLRVAPLREQRRIVEKIEALLEQVNRAKERLDRVPLIVKRLRHAVLAAACSGELVGERGEVEGPFEFLPLLPAGWRWMSAEAVCERVVDCHNKTAPYALSGIRLLRTTNIRRGRLVLDDARYVSEETYKFWSRRCPPAPGDVLFTREAPMNAKTSFAIPSSWTTRSRSRRPSRTSKLTTPPAAG